MKGETRDIVRKNKKGAEQTERNKLPFQAGHEGGQSDGPQPRVLQTDPGPMAAASRPRPGSPVDADDAELQPHACLVKGGAGAICEQ